MKMRRAIVRPFTGKVFNDKLCIMVSTLQEIMNIYSDQASRRVHFFKGELDIVPRRANIGNEPLTRLKNY